MNLLFFIFPLYVTFSIRRRPLKDCIADALLAYCVLIKVCQVINLLLINERFSEMIRFHCWEVRNVPVLS